MMKIRYDLTGDAWTRFDECVLDLARRTGAKRVCDVGGGANPVLRPAAIQELSLDCVVLDISASELEKAPAGYDKLVADISRPLNFEGEQFDLVFSKMLAEHVQDGRCFHANIFRMLKPGGRAFHFFPTLYAFPFIVNSLMPEALAQSVLRKLSRDRLSTGRHDKFPAHYSWTYGPTRAQIARLESLGYEIEEYVGLFGHEGYYVRIPAVAKLHLAYMRQLIRHPIPGLTSYAFLTLRKPG